MLALSRKWGRVFRFSGQMRTLRHWKNQTSDSILPSSRCIDASCPVNTRKERNDDDHIDDLHSPCHVLDRSNLQSRRQTLARFLSLQANVTPSHLRLTKSIETALPVPGSASWESWSVWTVWRASGECSHAGKQSEPGPQAQAHRD